MGCDTACGVLTQICTTNTSVYTPCDCNDSDPNVYPGHGC
jgi:hypothetical protein